jgi:hypothetical protein
MSKLEDELAKDESLWRMWREEGVTESTPLAIDVFFYATAEDAARQIADCMGKWSLKKVKITTKRLLLVFKGWEITGVDEGTWSLEKLQERSKRYVRLAEIFDARYEGCGALMPDKTGDSKVT